MPCLNIDTNVNLDGVDTDPIFAQLTTVISQIVGRSENFVMILAKGSARLTFGGNKEPAALAEIVAIDVINTEMKRKLIATIGTILENSALSIPRARFVLKVVAPKTPLNSKL